MLAPPVFLLVLPLVLASSKQRDTIDNDCVTVVDNPNSLFGESKSHTPALAKYVVEDLVKCMDVCCNEENTCNVGLFLETTKTYESNCVLYECYPLDSCHLKAKKGLKIFIGRSSLESDNGSSSTSTTTTSDVESVAVVDDGVVKAEGDDKTPNAIVDSEHDDESAQSGNSDSYDSVDTATSKADHPVQTSELNNISQILTPNELNEDSKILTQDELNDTSQIITPNELSDDSQILTPNELNEDSQILTPDELNDTSQIITPNELNDDSQLLRPDELNEESQIVTPSELNETVQFAPSNELNNTSQTISPVELNVTAPLPDNTTSLQYEQSATNTTPPYNENTFSNFTFFVTSSQTFVNSESADIPGDISGDSPGDTPGDTPERSHVNVSPTTVTSASDYFLVTPFSSVLFGDDNFDNLTEQSSVETITENQLLTIPSGLEGSSSQTISGTVTSVELTTTLLTFVEGVSDRVAMVSTQTTMTVSVISNVYTTVKEADTSDVPMSSVSSRPTEPYRTATVEDYLSSSIVNETYNITRVHHVYLGHEPPENITAILYCTLAIGCVFTLAVAGVLVARAYDCYRKRHYSRLDYLINGMYS